MLQSWSRVATLVALIIAGEMVFGLPFHTARFFRPTLLEVFSLSNTQLGDIFAAYGVLAMLAYFPGGALADRYPARNLLTASLVATAAGGFYMATIPEAAQLAVLYGYWGLTTILLFWGALIRATREWGGTSTQGIAFGTLEAGRGFAAASFAALSVFIFDLLIRDAAQMSAAERTDAFRAVILAYTLVTLLAATLVWFLVPIKPVAERGAVLRNAVGVVRRPVVWAQAAVIVCAYCGYKGLDNYSLYAREVLGMNEVAAAQFATWGSYLRPVGAMVAGILADRFRPSRIVAVTFLAMLVSYLALARLHPQANSMAMIYTNFFVSFFAVYAIRGVYFALLEENRTPANVTGTTVGVVSLLGFTPEIFFGPVSGRILDASPGIAGHHDYFLLLAGFATAGLVAVGLMLLLNRRNREEPQHAQ